MRRALVLTDETARHPFLASLAPHIRRAETPPRPRSRWKLNVQDAQDFLIAYCACFVCVSAFIG